MVLEQEMLVMVERNYTAGDFHLNLSKDGWVRVLELIFLLVFT